MDEIFKIQLRVVDPGNKVVWDGDTKGWVPYTGTDAEAGRRFNYDDSRLIEYTYQGSESTTDLEVIRRRLATIYDTLGAETRVELDPRSDTCQGDVIKVMDVLLGEEITRVNFTSSFEG